MVINLTVEVTEIGPEPYYLRCEMNDEVCARLGSADKIFEELNFGIRAMVRRLKDKKVLEKP